MRHIIFGLLVLAAHPAMAESLPQPPKPPASIPDRDPAPTPNKDMQVAAPSSQHANVEFRNFQRSPADAGVAFAPGSRFRTPEERKPIQTPGVSVTVPIN